MSVVRRPTVCPACASERFHELGRFEAGEAGFAEDVAVYSCDECGAEWDTTDVPGDDGGTP